ncbi:hypothetical protein [Streptomyces sp. CA-111067]|uniref:hypothetical protein n=1 Tax=Streptomyces sp. CA-111067 TaxID=3240046 RepID=UPI003D99BAC2
MAAKSSLTLLSKNHRIRLEKAAGVTTVNLVCTVLTWEKLRSQAIMQFGSVLPSAPTGQESNALIRIPLTGPQLAQLMQQALKGSIPFPPNFNAHPASERALFQRAYDVIAEVTDELDLANPDGKPVRDIVIDSRHGTG